MDCKVVFGPTLFLACFLLKRKRWAKCSVEKGETEKAYDELCVFGQQQRYSIYETKHSYGVFSYPILG